MCKHEDRRAIPGVERLLKHRRPYGVLAESNGHGIAGVAQGGTEGSSTTQRNSELTEPYLSM